jgi:uncharacterized integral membrane protein
VETPEGPAPERTRRNEARSWVIVAVLTAAVAYLIAFAVENRTEVPIHWIFGTTRSSLIWVILVSLGLGLVVGVLGTQLGRRRRRRSEAADG